MQPRNTSQEPYHEVQLNIAFFYCLHTHWQPHMLKENSYQSELKYEKDLEVQKYQVWHDEGFIRTPMHPSSLHGNAPGCMVSREKGNKSSLVTRACLSSCIPGFRNISSGFSVGSSWGFTRRHCMLPRGVPTLAAVHDHSAGTSSVTFLHLSSHTRNGWSWKLTFQRIVRLHRYAQDVLLFIKTQALA